MVSLYSTGISQVVKTREVKKLRQDVENDLVIKDQMANLECVLVCTFGNFLAPILGSTHMVANLGCSHEQ